MSVQLILKNSSVEDRHPTDNQLTNGEISLNYNAAGAFLSCRDTNGDIQHLGGVKIDDATPGSPSKQALWFQPSTGKLFVYDGTGWLVVASGGSGPGSDTVDQILAGNGINSDPASGLGTITLDADIDTSKGLRFLSGKIALAIGEGLEFDPATGDVKATASATSYKGEVNLTTNAAKPTGVSAGDTFYNGGTGTSNAVWNPSPATGTSVTAGDLVVYNGTGWDYIPSGAAYPNPALWSRTSGVLSPATSSDDVEIGGGNITLASSGNITAGSLNTIAISKGANTVSSNLAIGDSNTLSDPALSGTINIGIGNSSLFNTTTGTSNVGIGPSALRLNTTGENNIALNYNALAKNVDGDNNVAIGRTALTENVSGGNNIAIGTQTLNSNVSGSKNTCVGAQAGFYLEGNNNTVLGAYKGTAADATLANTIILSAGTTQRLRIDSTGSLLFGGTLPSAPAITLNSSGVIDCTSLEVSKTNNPSITIDNTGNNTTARAATLIYNFSDGAGAAIQATRKTSETASDVYLSFRTGGYTNAQERMTIDSDGKLGIGTQDPQAKLHLRGDSTTKIWLENTANGSSTFNPGAASIDLTATAMNATSKYTPSINFGSTDAQFTTTNPKFGAAINAQAAQSYSSDTTGGMDLVFWTSPINPGTGSGLVQRMMIDTGGNVGINTNTPSGKLTVEGSQNADPTAAKNPIGDIYIQNVGGTQGLNNYGGSISFSRINKTRRGAMIAEVQTSTNAEQGGLAFFTKDNANSSNDIVVEKVRIDHDGQVNIGGTLPSAPAITLASGGDITTGGNLLLESGTGNNCTISTTVANGNDSHLRLKKSRGISGDVQDADSIGTIDFSGYYGSDYQTESSITCKAVIGASYSDKLQYFSNRHDFVTSNNTRMTIDSDGNIGINTTDPQVALDVNGEIDAKSITLDNPFGNSVARNSTIDFTHQDVIGASVRGIRPAGGSQNNVYLQFETGGVLTPKMTIDSAGVVGIGGTLPSAPNIALAQNGTITTTNTITAGGNPNAAQNNGARLGANGYLAVSGVTGNGAIASYLTGTSTPTFEVTADGDVTSAGPITAGGNPGSGANTGVRVTPIGLLAVSKDSGTTIQSFTTGDSTPTFTVDATGRVVTEDDIVCSDNSKGLVLKSPNGTSFRLSVANNGFLYASAV